MSNEEAAHSGETNATDDAEAERHEREIERRSNADVWILHDVVLREGQEEMSRASSALFFSGFAAGLAMGLSLIVEGALRSVLPDEPWARQGIARLGYCVGFVIVTLGRQQLFTEKTLTAVLPVLDTRGGRAFAQMLRVWGVVLVANLLGLLVISWVCARTEAFSGPMRVEFAEISRKAMEPAFGTMLLRGILSGWLIALIVWLVPACEGSARLWIVVLITYIVAITHMNHVIAGSAEAMYLAWVGEISHARLVAGFFVPTIVGNVVGGVVITAMINHAQVVYSDK